MNETSKSKTILESLPKDEEIGTFSKTVPIGLESGSIPHVPELDNPEHKEGALRLTLEQMGTADRLAAMLNMHRNHTHGEGAARRNTCGPKCIVKND